MKFRSAISLGVAATSMPINCLRPDLDVSIVAIPADIFIGIGEAALDFLIRTNDIATCLMGQAVECRCRITNILAHSFFL